MKIRQPRLLPQVLPQVRQEVQTSSDRDQITSTLPPTPRALPQASVDWTSKGTFFFMERDKSRTRGFN